MEGISVSFSIDRVLDVMELFIMNKSFEGNAIIFSLLSSLLISSTKEYNFQNRFRLLQRKTDSI